MAEAKEWLLTKVEQGVNCPTCTLHAKVYKRPINSGMARSLIAIYRQTEPDFDYIHVPTALDARSREEGKLAYWGLLEEERVRRPDGGRAGYWRITEKGAMWVRGYTTVPKYARVYGTDVVGFFGESWSVVQALGKKFDYQELMSR